MELSRSVLESLLGEKLDLSQEGFRKQVSEAAVVSEELLDSLLPELRYGSWKEVARLVKAGAHLDPNQADSWLQRVFSYNDNLLTDQGTAWPTREDMYLGSVVGLFEVAFSFDFAPVRSELTNPDRFDAAIRTLVEQIISSSQYCTFSSQAEPLKSAKGRLSELIGHYLSIPDDTHRPQYVQRAKLMIQSVRRGLEGHEGHRWVSVLPDILIREVFHAIARRLSPREQMAILDAGLTLIK